MSRIGIGIKVVEVLGDTYYIAKPILENLIKKYGKSFIKVKGDLKKVPKNMPKFSMTKAMREKLANAAAAKGKSPSSKNQLSDLMKSMGAAGKTLKSGGTKKGQGRTRRGSETKAPKSGGTKKDQGRTRRGSTSKNKAPEVTTKSPTTSSKVTSGGKSNFPSAKQLKTWGGIGAGLVASGAIAKIIGDKVKSPTIIKDGGPSRSGGASKDMRSRRGSTSVKIKIDPKAVAAKGNVTKVFKVTDGSPNKIDIGKTNFNVPRSIAAAKDRGSKYFYDKSGVKKLAVTAEDLKKSGKSLREWANTFARKKHSKLDTTAFTRTIAAMGKN